MVYCTSQKILRKYLYSLYPNAYINSWYCSWLQWMPFMEYAAQPFVQKSDILKFINDICLAKIDGQYSGYTPVSTLSNFSEQQNYMYLNAGALKRSNSWKALAKVKQLDRIFNLCYIVMFDSLNEQCWSSSGKSHWFTISTGFVIESNCSGNQI